MLSKADIRNDWQLEEVLSLYEAPFGDVVSRARSVFEQNWNTNKIQISTLCSIKTGNCPENCAYCSQSAFNKTDIKKNPMMKVADVVEAAKKAKQMGATRFCMSASGRKPSKAELDVVCEMIKGVKSLNIETCMTLGMLTLEQARELKKAGLDYYNHNIDTSPDYYKEIITSRTFQDRLDTLENLRKIGIKVCCGGIVGMGERREDRAQMLLVLANLDKHPESVPINAFVPIKGTKLENVPLLDVFEFIRTIAIARIMMPKSYVRLSAGREKMSDEMQAFCFFAGANSIFYGEKLLTVNNPVPERDRALFERLGLESYQIKRRQHV